MKFSEIYWNLRKFSDFLGFLCISAFFGVQGGPGHLKKVNIAIGISTFSAWGRQEPSKSLEKWFSPEIC